MLVALTYTFPFSNLQTHRDVDWAALSYILELMSRIFVFVHRCEGFQMKKKKRDAWQKKEIYKWTNFVFAFTSFANWALRWSSSHLTFLGFSLHFFAPIFSLTEQTLLSEKRTIFVAPSFIFFHFLSLSLSIFRPLIFVGFLVYRHFFSRRFRQTHLRQIDLAPKLISHFFPFQQGGQKKLLKTRSSLFSPSVFPPPFAQKQKGH